MADAPLSARQMPIYIEETRVVEIRTMLKLGRDSNWPLSITLASEINENTSLSVTYAIDWNGINWEDDEKSRNWCWNKFLEAARTDSPSAPPAQRSGNLSVTFDIALENWNEHRIGSISRDGDGEDV
jgi:hypothetical protein